jgi:hypothetical protein
MNKTQDIFKAYHGMLNESNVMSENVSDDDFYVISEWDGEYDNWTVIGGPFTKVNGEWICASDVEGEYGDNERLRIISIATYDEMLRDNKANYDKMTSGNESISELGESSDMDKLYLSIDEKLLIIRFALEEDYGNIEGILNDIKTQIGEEEWMELVSAARRTAKK